MFLISRRGRGLKKINECCEKLNQEFKLDRITRLIETSNSSFYISCVLV